MLKTMSAAAVICIAALAAAAAFAADSSAVSDPAHDTRGTTAPASGVSPPGSARVVPEVPANKEPKSEKAGSGSVGSSSGTSGVETAPIPPGTTEIPKNN